MIAKQMRGGGWTPATTQGRDRRSGLRGGSRLFGGKGRGCQVGEVGGGGRAGRKENGGGTLVNRGFM